MSSGPRHVRYLVARVMVLALALALSLSLSLPRNQASNASWRSLWATPFWYSSRRPRRTSPLPLPSLPLPIPIPLSVPLSSGMCRIRWVIRCLSAMETASGSLSLLDRRANRLRSTVEEASFSFSRRYWQVLAADGSMVWHTKSVKRLWLWLLVFLFLLLFRLVVLPLVLVLPLLVYNSSNKATTTTTMVRDSICEKRNNILFITFTLSVHVLHNKTKREVFFSLVLRLFVV
mmetsp:Transcript_17906/g.37474  ORF Transcript_17906/g.37474 Transcript_17906/m.37474 type:complete len:232 (+) Transcript_17906:438-1133(+)